MKSLPSDYEERVYAGVLGKIIGVYLGRPFEGWSNARIQAELGDINYYVHEKLSKPLVVPDDDLSGTFTFLRALPDSCMGHGITPEAIGSTWLNYLIENRTVLWWGGLGVSTEHTAYLRLKNGAIAPQSGSCEINGKTVSEQIGAQIFIDGWAMVCPGDPEKAAALAHKAASVSHDGEAVWAAQVIAAMESLAFVEPDITTLLTTATTFIPRASTIYALVQDLFEWKGQNLHDWRATFANIQEKYGYDTFGGGCHVVPNHAVVLLALLYGDDDFQKSLMIANTAGWDTDCNSGNVGCLMGIKNGLAGLDKGADFRTPVADKLLIPTIDGGRCITDAVRETYAIVNIARALQNEKPVLPNHGMRFHFNLPGSLQGFTLDDGPQTSGVARLENVQAKKGEPNGADDERMLAISYQGIAPGRVARISTPTFLTPDQMNRGTGYALAASPTLYSGQTLRARIIADQTNTRPAPVRLFVRVYGENDELELICSPEQLFAPDESHHFHWDVPDVGGKIIAEVGVQVGGSAGTGTVYLDWMGWGGAPTTVLQKPEGSRPGQVWHRAWVSSLDQFRAGSDALPYHCIQNDQTGLFLHGTQDWCDYQITTTVCPHLAHDFGLVANVRGLRRWAAFVLRADQTACLIECRDGEETVLAEAPCAWELNDTQPITLTAYRDGTLTARYGDESDEGKTVAMNGYMEQIHAQGAMGFRVSEGGVSFGPVRCEPAPEILIG